MGGGLSLSLAGSWGLSGLVEGVSWLGGHIVLRNWHQQEKVGWKKQDARWGKVATVTSSLVCQVTTMVHILTICYEPLVISNIPAFLI